VVAFRHCSDAYSLAAACCCMCAADLDAETASCYTSTCSDYSAHVALPSASCCFRLHACPSKTAHSRWCSTSRASAISYMSTCLLDKGTEKGEESKTRQCQTQLSFS
jgi:hypothetical protein